MTGQPDTTKDTTPGSLPQQDVGDRDNVGTTTPEAYPAADREMTRVDRFGDEHAASTSPSAD